MSASGGGQASAPRPGAFLRLIRAWGNLPGERRLAALAALGLVVTLFLPWYQETVIASGGSALRSASASLTGWGAFSFVEAALLLVAGGVLVLLFVRAEGGAFHVPGGDGGVVTAAGLWACVLILWRIFDKEGTTVHGQYTTTSGIEWGIFFALAVAALLAYAGSQIRRAHEPEPPLPGEPGAKRSRRGGGLGRGRRRGTRQPPEAAPAPRRIPHAPDMEADETWIQHPDAPLDGPPGEPRRKHPANVRLDPHEIHELDIAEPPTSPLERYEPPTAQPTAESQTEPPTAALPTEPSTAALPTEPPTREPPTEQQTAEPHTEPPTAEPPTEQQTAEPPTERIEPDPSADES